ncbi:unnamed protein product [Parajaminaea phylloscopi]
MVTETVLITGAGGWLGSLLSEALSREDPSVTFHFILADVNMPPTPRGLRDDARVVALSADLTKEGEIQKLFTTELGSPDTIYSMHGIMSLGSEQQFDLGMTVNFDSTRALLNRARRAHTESGKLVKFILTSSVATYGGPLPDVVVPSTTAAPESSYGTAKLLCELLVTEYSRRGFVDGRSVKLPTVVVRPGPPSQATSAFVSGIVREPLEGKRAVCPIGTGPLDPLLRETRVWVASRRVTLSNLCHARKVPATLLPAHSRSVALPGFTVTVRGILDALCRVTGGGQEALQLIDFEHDETCKRIVTSWPSDFDTQWAVATLGFRPDAGGFDGAAREFQRDQERISQPHS